MRRRFLPLVLTALAAQAAGSGTAARAAPLPGIETLPVPAAHVRCAALSRFAANMVALDGDRLGEIGAKADARLHIRRAVTLHRAEGAAREATEDFVAEGLREAYFAYRDAVATNYSAWAAIPPLTGDLAFCGELLGIE